MAKTGRPPVDTDAVTVRLRREVIAQIDDWRRGQDDLPTRPEAIRRLTAFGLTLAPQYEAIKDLVFSTIATEDGKPATAEHADIANAFMAADDIIHDGDGE